MNISKRFLHRRPERFPIIISFELFTIIYMIFTLILIITIKYRYQLVNFTLVFRVLPLLVTNNTNFSNQIVEVLFHLHSKCRSTIHKVLLKMIPLYLLVLFQFISMVLTRLGAISYFIVMLVFVAIIHTLIKVFNNIRQASII
jgi:hypothetical protein